jgi:hypothetical protein
LQEGTDIKYGARHLKRAIEKFVVYPLANLLSTDQVWLGDSLVIDWDQKDQRLAFHREGQGAVIAVPKRRPVREGTLRIAASASGGDKTKTLQPDLEPVLTR